MTNNFHKHLLSELHMVVYQPGDPSRLNDRLLCEAVTVNENLRSLGYVLRPEDLLRLAVSSSLYDFYQQVKRLVPEVKAQPMYPGFPRQVMEMSEAEFRFHQMLHYFSTYGVELLTGAEVARGWLPAYNGPERTESDTRLLDAAVVELVSAQDAPIEALKILLGRRERLTNPEQELVLESAAACTAEQMQGLSVRFKENLELLFPMVLEKADRETALRTLQMLCSHCGDVLRCSADYIRSRKYHLRTSEKKLLVKLLESYPVWNLRQNLMQSNSLRERNLLTLKHLDYNRYSRSDAHREAVRALRSGELLSWHGIGEALLKEHSPRALEHLAQRPGYTLRMLNRLLSLGYTQDQILEALYPKAEAISGHLILKVLRMLTSRKASLPKKHQAAVEACEQKYAQELRCSGMYWIVRDFNCRKENCRAEAVRKRARAKDQYLDCPMWEVERKAEDMVREFQEMVSLQEEVLETLRYGLKKQEGLQNMSRPHLISNAHVEMDQDLVWCLYDPAYFRNAIARCQEELQPLRERLANAEEEKERWLKEEAAAILARNQDLYDREIQQADLWETTRLAEIEAEYQQALDNADEKSRAIAIRKEAELAALEAEYQRQQEIMQYDSQSVQILKELLKEHFRKASTVLKGKKIYCDLQQFDLVHSSLETEDRSRDGGYIRSGIAWKIPDGARYVRFFTYWNDRSRVDIDLHAGGVTTDGENIHVGWNADFRNCGVVHSGDITHSNAAEYIDIDLKAPIREIYANVNFFNGRSFRDIETCYVGMMAVDKIGDTVRHYDPANCFFTHELTQKTRNLFYGYVDVQNRCVRFVGQENHNSWEARPQIEDAQAMFSVQDYLDAVLEGQMVTMVKTAQEADVVLTMGKSMMENGISLVDNNFFLEC
ncbi:MAG: hypothetical protein J6V25_09720 [Oscillospiraceae bacterium]|nr:hypothetical protein [Oscillospiraceae bacterium]